jgi:tetratricopeptide (TPR) repeat protein
MFAVATVVLAQAVSTAPGTSAPLARVVCAEGGARRANVWERAKSPELRRYCDLLASASSKLAAAAPMASAALDAAREADTVLPGRAAPRVLEGRALAVLGRFPEALDAFGDARSRDPLAFDEPPALLAFARVLAATGHEAEASRAYRALLPRASSLSGSERATIAAEAGLEAMQLGPDAIDEAAADLREALRDADGDAERFVVLALALALDRSGKAAEARTLLAERSRGEPRAAVAAWARKSHVAVRPSEAAALAAFALESSDPAGARDGWEEGLRADPAGPWAPYEHDHIAALRGGPARRTK